MIIIRKIPKKRNKMKRKKLLEWKQYGKSQIAEGNTLIFAYQKVGRNYMLLIEANGLATRLICKTERHCLMISNILNQV